MKVAHSDISSSSIRRRFYLRALIPVFFAFQLLLTLNFSSLELLPPGSAISYNYGWPLPIYKKGLQLGASMEFQILSVCGDIIINGLLLYGLWSILLKIMVLWESDFDDEPKPVRFHLITLLIATQILGIFLYLNTAPRKYDFEFDHNINYGWPALIFTLSFDPKIPPHISFMSVAVDLGLAFTTTYYVAVLCEKVIAWRSRKVH